MCVFSLQYGPDWTVVSGAPNGITQLATSSLPLATTISAAILGGGNTREVVWNFPIGLAFKSTSPFGWPRIVVTVYGTDLCNRRVIKGYGSVHVPCQPGKHVPCQPGKHDSLAWRALWESCAAGRPSTCCRA